MFTSKRIFCLSVVALAAGLVAVAGARAEEPDTGFRCGRRLVSNGDHMVEVKKKCGEPEFVIQRTIKRKVKVRARTPDLQAEESDEVEVDVLIDEWTYDLGPRRFIRFVQFENGRVIGVTTGGYGSKAIDE
jgi:hypothetical protein